MVCLNQSLHRSVIHGLAGSHVIYVLQKTRRYKVISVDNGHNSNPTALDRVSQLSKSELTSDHDTEIDTYECDLTQPDQIRAVFETYGKAGIWGVIHIAVSLGFYSLLYLLNPMLQAHKAVGESAEIPLTYYANNVAATISLLQIMAEYDCKRIVYSSSATVYGTPPIIPIPETTRLQADSPYGKTKVMVENIIEDLCHCMYVPIVFGSFRNLDYTQRIKTGAPSYCDTSSMSNKLNIVCVQLNGT